MPSSSKTNYCHWCDQEATLECKACHTVSYCGTACQGRDWKEGGHRIVCKHLPEAIAKAEAVLQEPDTTLHSFERWHYGGIDFGLSEAQAERGLILAEEQAQELCYDAMEMEEGSPEKIKILIKALKVFPWSTEAWGMIGGYYRYDLHRKKREYDKALRMYDNAIACARKLNPSWGEDRRERLEWSLIYTRPYLRALLGHAITLQKIGQTAEAVREGKRILKWNRNDNQGVRSLMVNWTLAAGDTEGCLNVLRGYDVDSSAALAYSDVLLQFLRWKQDDILEEDVQRALFRALKANLYVPELLLRDKVREKKFNYLDLGGPKEARYYAQDAHEIWRSQPESLEWLALQKSKSDASPPPEENLITLLRSGVIVFVTCTHTNLDGGDAQTSTLRVTQKRGRCFGCAAPGFYWPPVLDCNRTPGDPILLFHHGLNPDDGDNEKGWRQTRFRDITEVPFWKVLLQLASEEEFE